MIEIKKHLISHGKNPDVEIDEAVRKLWNYLTPVTKGNLPSAKSILTKVKKLRELVSSDLYTSKYPLTYQRHEDLLEFLDDENVLKWIVCAKPEEYKCIIGNVYQFVSEEDLFVKSGGSFKKTYFGGLLIDRLFNYNSYRSSNELYDIYKGLFFNAVTCVYCNVDTVTIINDKIENGTPRHALFELDHFYPKSKYPYLALSFFNHIPSCSNCNGKLKRSRDFTIETHIHPYNRCFNSLYSFVPNVEAIQFGVLNEIDIKLKNGEIDYLVKDLKLKSRYEKFITLSSSDQLVCFLHKYRDILTNPNANTDMKEMLVDSLLTHVSLKEGDILKKSYSKLKLDIIRCFDIHSQIVN